MPVLRDSAMQRCMWPHLHLRLVLLPSAIFALLVWSAQSVNAAEPSPNVSDSREMLKLFGVDASDWAALEDDGSFANGNQEALLGILFAVRRFRLADIERARQLEALFTSDAGAHALAQGEIYHLTGHVLRVTVEQPLLELGERFELDRLYRCEVQVGQSPRPAVVYALAVPRQWPINRPLRERISLDGFFLRRTAAGGSSPQPIFAAQRVAWHPPTPLGDLGMDVGLFDEVKNGRPLAARERECFYQLLAAAGRAGSDQLLRATQHDPQHDSSVVPLFNQPETQHGKAVALTGTARRAILVRVSDPDVQARFGFDHYYQVEIFTPDSQNNPLIFCVRQLPPGMPSGPHIHETVRIPSYFMKTWAYERPQTNNSPAGWQLAPLLIGHEPIWSPPQTAENSQGQLIAAGLLLIVIAGVSIALWRAGRGDLRFRERLANKQLPIVLDDAE